MFLQKKKLSNDERSYCIVRVGETGQRTHVVSKNAQVGEQSHGTSTLNLNRCDMDWDSSRIRIQRSGFCL